jgi:hypothetical protein
MCCAVQVLSVLKHEKPRHLPGDASAGSGAIGAGMRRAEWDQDTRHAREKEQVVCIDAVGVTILWVNCTVARVEELLRDLERECVEGMQAWGWLGTRCVCYHSYRSGPRLRKRKELQLMRWCGAQLRRGDCAGRYHRTPCSCQHEA